MAVAGLRGTGDWSESERPTNFRESILYMEPQGDTPLTALLGKVKSAPTNDPQYSWWAEPRDLIYLTLNGDFGTSDTLLTLTVNEPSAANIKQHWSSALHLIPGDVLMAEPTADAAVYNYEQMVVTAVHSPTQFSVQRAAFGTVADDLPVNGKLLKIGSAFAEGTAAPTSTTRNPVKYTNFTQIWKTTYELTNTAKATHLRTGDALTNDKKRRMTDHAKDIELSLLFGVPSESVGENGKPKRTTAGIRYMIPEANTTILEDNWGLAKSAVAGNNMIDAISPVFDYSSPAGDTRIALCGNAALNNLNRAIVSSSGATGVDLSRGMAEKVYGMNFRELTFPQGRILLKTHPLLSRHPLYTNSMWILDFSALKWRPLEGRDTKGKDNIQTEDEDVQRGMWLTEAGLMVDMGGQTLGYIGNLGAVVA